MEEPIAYGYARVSTREQNENRQIKAVLRSKLESGRYCARLHYPG